ncbi:hypothetical protein niasHT_002056 [Heterodera trifolii]|uniref:Protein kinase domain-containing protein n=1 Tax=Heterodera trifolii TaxID=157864 RepID=A0ABD2M3E5_9BILA
MCLGTEFDDSPPLFSLTIHFLHFNINTSTTAASSNSNKKRRGEARDKDEEEDDRPQQLRHIHTQMTSSEHIDNDLVSQSPGTLSEERFASDYELVSLSPGTRVCGRWTIIKELGQGAFGTVFLCKDTTTGRQAAMKTESADADPFLWQEAAIMRSVHSRGGPGTEHFCRCFDEGKDIQRDSKRGTLVSFNYIVMSLIGRGLFGLLSRANDKFSPGTAIGVSIQLLHALKTLHNIGYLHLDVKPENAVIGRRESNERQLIFLIDFGLARKYVSRSGKYRRERSRTHFRGTPMYASISAHARSDYCRADDIESWFYTMVDMYAGQLPWTNEKNEHKTGRMKSLRLNDQPEEVRQKALHALLKRCPPIFYEILDHIDELEFYERPNYEWIELVLRGYLIANDIQEKDYDWERTAG